MGLILGNEICPKAYHKITSFDVHLNKKFIRVRTAWFPDYESRESLPTTDWAPGVLSIINGQSQGNSEIKLCEKEFRNYRLAEKNVKDADVQKIADSKIKEQEKNLKDQAKKVPGLKVKLTAEEKKSVFTNAKSNVVATEAKLIGDDTIKSMFKDFIEGNSLAVLYKYIKKTEKYMDAQDK